MQQNGQFQEASPWKLNATSKRIYFESGALGIERLPNQAVRSFKQKIPALNLMIVGESGLGKSTFINTLFSSDLYALEMENLIKKTIKITPTTFELDESGVKLMLTIIDTPGFGDGMNREFGFAPILSYIDSAYEAYHKGESTKDFRTEIPDTRIHALLYFIAPNGLYLKELDINFLKLLSTKTNIIPVIGKSDTLTDSEKAVFKNRILNDLSRYDIKIYPTAYSEDRDPISHLEQFIPFGVSGSASKVRVYPWGTVDGKLALTVSRE